MSQSTTPFLKRWAQPPTEAQVRAVMEDPSQRFVSKIGSLTTSQLKGRAADHAVVVNINGDTIGDYNPSDIIVVRHGKFFYVGLHEHKTSVIGRIIHLHNSRFNKIWNKLFQNRWNGKFRDAFLYLSQINLLRFPNSPEAEAWVAEETEAFLLEQKEPTKVQPF